jgi:hemerythrin-like metal-binding protein
VFSDKREVNARPEIDPTAGAQAMNTAIIGAQIQIKTALFKWSDSYGVNIIEFDQQHRMIVVVLNELKAALERGQQPGELINLLEGLLNSISDHFNSEEDIFAKYAYPWALTHKAEHSAFKQSIATFVGKYQAGAAEMNGQFLDCCGEWLKRHIIGQDKTYSYYFFAKGLR